MTNVVKQTQDIGTKWKTRLLVMTVFVGLVCFMSMKCYLANRPETRQGASARRTEPLAVLAPLADPAFANRNASVILWSPTLAEMFGRSPLYVRCRPAGWNPPFARYTIVYPIYGDIPDKSFTVDLSHDVPADCVEDIRGTIGGPDRIVELRPLPRNSKVALDTGVKYQMCGTWYNADEAEADMLRCINDGSGFDISARYVGQQMIDAQLVVRAQLMEADADQSKWKIVRALQGDAGSKTLILDNQFFLGRAKAIVAAAARKQGKSPTEQETALDITAETSLLTKAEFTAQVEAILFVDQIQVQGKSVHGRLRYRAYGDFDRLEHAISHPDQSSDNEL